MPTMLKERLKIRNDSEGSSTSDEEVRPSLVPLFKLAPARLYQELAPLMLTFSELSQHGYPFQSHDGNHAVFWFTPTDVPQQYLWKDRNDPQRKCARCGQNFLVGDNSPCLHHHRLLTDPKTNQRYLPCCLGNRNSKGCSTADCHVSNEMSEDILYEFVKTPLANGINDYRSKKVYALDTEAVYTENGMEVARVSLVDMEGRTVLDVFVLPRSPVLDYNTAYSGVRPNDMEQAVSLDECHRQLFQFVNEYTILVGHALENDFRYLRLVHFAVIDTAVVFIVPHNSGYRKQSLRSLAWKFLEKDIQDSQHGHSSVEDAVTCIQLLVARDVFYQYFVHSPQFVA